MERNLPVAHAFSVAVALLAGVASAVGVFHPDIYRDSVSLKAQAQGQDLVTLAFGVPLLLLGVVFSYRRSHRGRLIWLGALAYMLYTYAMAATGIRYNPLFLLYVTIFSLSLFGVILGLRGTDPRELADVFTDKVPVRTVSAFLVVMAMLVANLWLSQLVPALLHGTLPPMMVQDEVDTLVIQVMDLGLLVPLFALAGVLLWKRRPWGYLLAGIMLVKAGTLGLAVVSMILFMSRRGVPVEMPVAVMFCVLTAFSVLCATLMLRRMQTS